MTNLSVADAAARAVGQQVKVQGWVRTRRDSKGGFSFLELNDGSCLRQCPGHRRRQARQLRDRDQEARRRLQRHRRRRGQGVAGQGAGDRGARRAASSSTAGPIRRRTRCRRKGHSFEFLRTIAHLRPRTNTFGAVARAAQLRLPVDPRFLPGARLPLHPPPIITASDCEGAGQMFRVTTLDLAKLPRKDGRRRLPAGLLRQRPTYLTVSGQLEAEIFACASGKVYTFGPTFRAENSNTSRHLAEFWMVEPEMAFYELTDNMDLAEAFLKRIFRDVLDRCAEDMQFFNERIDKTVIATLESVVNSEFRAAAVHRGGRHPGEVGPDVRVSGGVGQRPAGRARALSDREALQAAGDPVRLSAQHQGVLHAAQRRRQDGAGDGRAGAAASARSSAAASARSGWTCWNSA